MSSPMYVVLEWNQASGQPEAQTEVYDDKAEAEENAAAGRRVAEMTGRRERYTVHELCEADGED
jgi:hypothetical protein